MEGWSTGARWRYGAVQGAGLGLAAGACEVLVHALAGREPWTWAYGLVLGLVAALGMAGIAAVAGLLVGPVHTLRAEQPAYRTIALQVALVGALLTALYLVPWALQLVADGRATAAVAMAMMPVGTLGVLYFNARYWLARVETGKPVGPGFLPVVAVGSAVAIVAAAALGSARDTGGAFALGDDPSVLLVTVDGLRHDEVGALGGSEATPGLDGWVAEGGMAFLAAVAPSPSTVAAHGALLTGLHPLRHQAFDDLHPLPLGLQTVPERFEQEGFATAAFLSSAAVADVGLDQGFRVVDDRFAPFGLDALVVGRWLGGARWVRRTGDATVAAFGAWLDANPDVPAFLWVHLEHRADEPVADLDARLVRLLGLLDAHARADRTLVAIVGATGAAPGVQAAGLSDRLVRVPLLLKAPGRPAVPRVAAQVRLLDVPVTAVAYVGMQRMDTAEGIDLLGFGDGRRSEAVWSALIGHSEDDAPLVGLRQDDVKAVVDLARDEVELYDLSRDPGEAHDLSVEQPDPAARAKALLAPDAAALQALWSRPGLGASRAARLAALED
ncbi:MAG: sulfatase-like hydrolase/transferase [Alphaproteobacteria bacterium]|nr:sulfatase-like hydrolase/transferase [Alphaproteobacteria bacterium]